MKRLYPILCGVLALVMTVAIAREKRRSDSAAFAAGQESEPVVQSESEPASPDVAAAADPDERSADQAKTDNVKASDAKTDAGEANERSAAPRAAKPVRGQSRILHGKVVLLKNIRAPIARDLLKITYPDLFEDESTTYVDEEHNAITFSAPPEVLRPIEQFLTKLDQTAASLGVTLDDAGAEAPARDKKNVPDAADATEEEGAIKMFHLKRTDAGTCNRILAMLYPDLFKAKKVTAAPDRRTNSLVVRGPESILNVFEAIVLALDQVDTPTHFRRESTSPRGVGAAAGLENGSFPRTERADLPARREPAPADPLFDNYRKWDLEAKDLARQIREARQRLKPDDPELKRLQNDLEGAVHSAFYERQAAQQAQAKKMRERLDEIERRVKKRGKSANDIIRRRVDQLLDPENNWETEKDTSATEPVDHDLLSGRTLGADRQSRLGRDTSADEPAGRTVSPDRATPRDVERTLLPIASDRGEPRKMLLDADEAVDASRADVDEAEKSLALDQGNLNYLQSLLRKGTTTEKAVREAQRKVEVQKAAIERGRRAVTRAERQAQLARDAMAAEIKLLELDLADAELKLKQAQDDEARTVNLMKQNVIAKEEYDRMHVALQQAELQVKKAQVRLELYRRSLPKEE